MGEKVSRYKIYYYLFVLLLIVAFSVYYAFKQAECVHENYLIAVNHPSLKGEA